MGEVAAVKDEIRRSLPKVGENGLKCSQVAVNVRDNGDAHYLQVKLAASSVAPEPL